MIEKAKALKLRAEDNVANQLDPVRCGDEIIVLPEGSSIIATTDCQRYHKIALCDLPAAAEVMRDGIVIGVTKAPIAAGAHVHIHNLNSRRAQASSKNSYTESSAND
jgi:altronate hydrolase/altronate dehydratase small subunit